MLTLSKVCWNRTAFPKSEFCALSRGVGRDKGQEEEEEDDDDEDEIPNISNRDTSAWTPNHDLFSTPVNQEIIKAIN